jgi:hypothetical protein
MLTDPPSSRVATPLPTALRDAVEVPFLLERGGPEDPFERAAERVPRPGVSAGRAQRLAGCVQALAEGQPPQQVLAAARATAAYDDWSDLFKPLPTTFAQLPWELRP